MEIVALLPMKGHSERVENKNLKMMDGAPLYHAVMRQLLKSEYITRIVVNTDSDDISEDIHLNFPGVVIHRRKEEICGDMVSMNDVIADDIRHFPADLYLQTHSTNPLILARTLDKAIAFFLANAGNYDSLYSVTKMQTRLYRADGSAYNHSAGELLRTQDLEPLFEENSCFYVFTAESFAQAGNKRIGQRPKMFDIHKIEAIDIDDPEDFVIAEILYKGKGRGKSNFQYVTP